ncbi:chromosomal protein D1-like [Phlebotomus argentipes]|uniref:chromosomal protein D1-like n=1 Tax=Phlebotomus argentipes TaxID=94469 RepID=UPI002892FB97|nr:chromosomal protein D1-like [Phlebotomus argentipes]XP_059609628.1 chromosomal protein D1-like [Phlebotomus argentipes]XP_059609629.1 chromosomal protein D1-like [Phlebotomus argentipes]XP_059609877.1 chromosomal protein D1-like [Phlebotomus argentipes]
MSDEEAPVVTGEKKRGRPAADKDKPVEAKKRPRTSSPEASEGKKVAENGNVAAKRGRGRPKAPAKVAVKKKPSRGRGRPKGGRKAKSSSSESEDESDEEEEDENDAEDSDE